MSTPLPRPSDELGAMDNTMMRKLFEAVPGRVAVIGRDRCYQFVNRELLELMGQGPDQFIGRHLRDVMGEENFKVFGPRVERLFDGETFLWEGWTDYPRIGQRYVQHHWVPYRPEGGEVSHMIAFARDFTEQKQQEARMAAQLAALEQTEALKSAIVDHALAAVVVADVDDVIVEFNPAAVAMFGIRRDAALGRSMCDTIIPPRLHDIYRRGMQEVAAGDPHRLLGRRIRRMAQRADGSEFAVEAVIWRVLVDGRSYWTASITDRSEVRAAAAQIERQREQLRQSEKLAAMGSLLAGVAHELNNPLAIVMGRASLLEEKIGEAALAQDARRIREAAERCGRIVRAFLNMARQKPAERSAVRLNELVRAALDLVGYTLRSHGIVVQLALADGLPEVQADADQIGQVVLNLIVNAQQALTGLGGPRHLALCTGRGAGEVWLRVADSGPGVDAALHERIFEPFFTTKGEGLGTGLGLSVSRGIARGHGGDLALDAHGTGAAAEATGACFRLSLPLGTATLADAVAAPPTASEAAAAARILVVDDEAEIGDLMRLMLESAGYEVSTAESGAVALEMLGLSRFDAVVSDLRMPDVDGAALWRALRMHDAALAQRMLFVTGDTLSPGAQQFLGQAGCPALDKPFGKAELLAAVQALLVR